MHPHGEAGAQPFEKDEECNVLLDFVGGGIKYSKVARTDKMLHAPAFFLETALIDVDSPTYETGKRQGGDFAFTFRYMPSGNFNYDDDDPRKGFVGFVGIVGLGSIWDGGWAIARQKPSAKCGAIP